MTAVTAASVKPLPYRPRLGRIAAILVTLSMMLLSAMLLTKGQLSDDVLLNAAVGITWLGFNIAFFLMLWTGRTDRFRAILFVLIALSLIVTFSAEIQAARGSNVLTI